MDGPSHGKGCELNTDSICVVADPGAPALVVRAREIASRLGLPVVEPVAERGLARAGLLLAVTPSRLELREGARGRSRPICVDFVGGPSGFRRLSAGSRRQPLARAVGLRGEPPLVLDATAGFARDAFLLASLGCRVTAVERSDVICEMIQDALNRAVASEDRKLSAVLARFRLVPGDAIRILDGIQRVGIPNVMIERPDVIYIDPMYPPSTKSAEVKREMRLLRRLIGSDPDAADLLAVACRVATRRVVVKRLRHSPPLASDPSHTVVATRVRYDVYLVPRRPVKERVG